MPIVPIERPVPDSGRSDSYEVGYGRPPRHTRFKAGQSGNPKGRPKGAKGFKTIIREAMLEKVRIRTGAGERKVPRVEALVLKTIELASKDNFRAMERLLGWYQEAVSDAPRGRANQPGREALSEADKATLAALRESIAAELAETPSVSGKRS